MSNTDTLNQVPEPRPIMIRILPIALLTTTAALAFTSQTPPASKPARPDAERMDGDKDARTSTPQAKRTDGYLATWLVTTNNNEVALAQLALQKATDPEVKKFAQRVIDEQRPFTQKLQPFASGAGPIGGAGSVSRAGEPKQVQEASSGRDGGEFNHVGLIDELGQQCLMSARKELEQKQGAEFDHCYMGMAIGATMGEDDMLTVFEKHASGPLAAAMTEGHRVVTKRLQDAKDGAKKMMEGAKTAARNDGDK